MALYRGRGRVVFPFGCCCLAVFLLCVLPRALRGGCRRVEVGAEFTIYQFTIYPHPSRKKNRRPNTGTAAQ